MDKTIRNYIIIAIVFLIMGFVIAPRQEVRQVPDQTRETNWKQLKEVDDQILLLSQQGFGACADFAAGVANSDVDKINQATHDLTDIADKIQPEFTQRNAIINKLNL